MVFDIVTIFPDFFDFYLKQSLLGKAIKSKKIRVNIYDLRRYAGNKWKSVDTKPFGGGRGMVLKIEPIYSCLENIKKKSKKGEKKEIVVFTPRGKKFNQKKANEWKKLDRLIMIAGRYEGIDERVFKYLADEKISIGNYVLMGGELPALVVVESISRLLPGIIGHSDELKERIDKIGGFIEYPQYAKPEVFETKDSKKMRVPKVLLSGNHKKIKEWREKHSKIIE